MKEYEEDNILLLLTMLLKWDKEKHFSVEEKSIKINVDRSMILVMKLYFVTEPNEKLFFLNKIVSDQTIEQKHASFVDKFGLEVIMRMYNYRIFTVKIMKELYILMYKHQGSDSFLKV